MKNEYQISGLAVRIVTLAALAFSPVALSAQSTYDDFEGKRLVTYHKNRTGVLDSLKKNPEPDSVNSSATCAMYVRNRSQRFDNIKMAVNGKLVDVSPYATYEGMPPRLKMKIYTTAPAGTLVEILLGSRGRNNEYPAGTHSQYQAYTKKSGEWEELEFLFSQIPQGSETKATEIDQVTLLFNPNSSTSDTYYFDEIRGPEVVPGATQVPQEKKPQQGAEKKGTNKKSK